MIYSGRPIGCRAAIAAVDVLHVAPAQRDDEFLYGFGLLGRLNLTYVTLFTSILGSRQRSNGKELVSEPSILLGFHRSCFAKNSVH